MSAPGAPDPPGEDRAAPHPPARGRMDGAGRMRRADGGGRVTGAPPVGQGADGVGRWLVAFMRRPPPRGGMAGVNGGRGLVVRAGGGVRTVVRFTIDAGRISALDVVRTPDKLTAV